METDQTDQAPHDQAPHDQAPHDQAHAAAEREAAVRARLAGASTGPWDLETDRWECYCPDTVSTPLATIAHAYHRGDAELITHAPADIAWLLAQLDATRAALAAVYTQAQDAHLREVEDLKAEIVRVSNVKDATLKQLRRTMDTVEIERRRADAAQAQLRALPNS